MKKLLLFFVSISLVFIAKAHFGFHGGADFYAGKVTYGNVSVTYDLKPGFTGGVFYSIPLNKDFSIAPGLDFVQKGGKINTRLLENGEPVAEGSSTLSLNYLQLPVNVMFKFKRLFIGAGPVLGLGINGKEKDMFDSSITTGKINFGNSETDDLKPFEFGLNMLAGYKLSNGLFINAMFNLGLNNIAPNAQSDAKFHNKGFALRIGYMF